MLLKKSGKVVQSNRLIEAHYRLNLQEKRFILWLISKIKPEDIEFQRYEISVKDFASMMGFNVKTQYKEMKGVTANLVTKLIQIENKKNNKVKQLAWLAFAEWDFDGGICFVEFHPELKPYLLQLKEQFTQIGFADLLGLSSSHSVRLLELLAQYHTAGRRVTTISEVRAWCGISEDEYPLYGNMKCRVIDKAKNEINEKTDFIVDYKEIKKSRKVDKLDWSIDKKKSAEDVVQPKEQSRPLNIVPINYESCQLPEVVEFCRHQEPTLRRDMIDYLLNATCFTMKDETVSVGFSAAFFRDRCDTEEVKRALALFFKTKYAEIV